MISVNDKAEEKIPMTSNGDEEAKTENGEEAIEETPSLEDFIGIYEFYIERQEIITNGGGFSDTIFEQINLLQRNDSIYNYSISNTDIDHDIVFKEMVREFYSFRYVNCSSTCTAMEYYPQNDSLFIFTRTGGLGHRTEYRTHIKL